MRSTSPNAPTSLGDRHSSASLLIPPFQCTSLLISLRWVGNQLTMSIVCEAKLNFQSIGHVSTLILQSNRGMGDDSTSSVYTAVYALLFEASYPCQCVYTCTTSHVLYLRCSHWSYNVVKVLGMFITIDKYIWM